MKPNLLAASLALALAATPAFAVAHATADAPALAQHQPAPRAKPVKELAAVSVSAALDQARNALSPDTGSS
ncbi:MAG TPA: hypothetical protein VFW82_08525, partial [Dyella sp.]|nr:hypothetical protein [Dyella sp.]